MPPTIAPPGHFKHGRPTIGMLFGFQVFTTGTVYGFIDSLTRGLLASARDRECNLLLSCGMNLLKPTDVRPAWPVLEPDADFVPVGPWNTDGLVIVHALLSEERTRYVRELKDSGFPVVFVGTATGGPAIAVDNDGGIRHALKHLAEHGHRRIAFIGGFPNDYEGDSGLRLRTFHTAAREMGLEVDPRLIEYGKHQIVEGQMAMKQILSSGAPFTAVLASNDESARGAIQALTEADIEVPQKVAVIGFDDRPDGAHKLPPLTTVHHPMFERGYRALGLLMDMLEGKTAKDDRIVNIPTRLAIRRTCGCSLGDVLANLTRTTADGSAAKLPPEERLTHAMTEAILAETHHTSIGEIYQLSRQLVDAFVASVKLGNPVDFLSSIHAVLGRMEQTGGTTRGWMLALDALQKAPELAQLVRSANKAAATSALTQTLFAHARTAINESVRRQHWLERDSVVDETSLMTARLLTALEETEVLKILAEHLPNIGIPRAAIVLFEPQGDDAVAWSVMRTSTDPEGKPVRFASRDFPPPGFSSPDGNALALALVPLSFQPGFSGYMVFDANNFKLCAHITHTVNTALKAARMFREASEGRRLAEEANRLKSRFLSTVGHELRTPLSLILATSELLEHEKDDQKGSYSQNLARIRASAQHLDGLIRDVLDLTRNELGQLKLGCEALDLAATLQPIAIVGEQLTKTKGLKWRIQVPTRLPKVWADRARLRQMVLNFITNAVKFTTQGEISLRIQTDDTSVTVTVQDTGLGIPREEQDVIFDDFQQSTRTTAHDYGGLGLGLAICKRLVEMHAGEIGVRSSGEEGSGSAFFFTLPVLEIGQDEIERALTGGQNVLILQDSHADTEKLRAALVQKKFNVQTIDASQPTPEPVTLTADLPTTILIDTALSSRRAWELVKHLKGAATEQRLSVLFYSLAPQRSTASVLNLDYLTKPVGTAELAQALQRQGITHEKGTGTVLVVDDDPGLLEMHARIVQTLSSSYRVLKALNGKDAVSVIQQERPDLVLLDLIMPEMDGFEVLEAMQKMETTRHIPVIVLTGQVLSEEEMARLNRGVAAVLGKGVFTVEETLTHIKETLDHTQKPGNEAQRLVRKAMAYLHKHYTKPVTREKIARYVNVSEDYLTRCFQQELHMPPMTYLTRYRINQAKALLVSGKMSVTEVAAGVGFSSEFYFNRVFRREVGVTPGSYRRGQRTRKE